MSSEEIKTIYKKLVQSYATAYPHGNSLQLLNTRIEAFVSHEWKAKEPAILDLALREDIEMPKVKELIEKGRTRKEAILEVSRNMKFQVPETEVKQWLEELKREKPRKVKKDAKQEIERKIEDYEETIEDESVRFKRKLFKPPIPTPTAPAKKLGFKTILKYFAHGLTFSVLYFAMVLFWTLILTILVVSGAIIGLIIGLGILFLIIGALNSEITSFLWFPVEASFWKVLLHGVVLFIVLLIVQGIFVWIPNFVFPSVLVQIVTLIVGTFLNGLVGKAVAGLWKGRED